MELPGLPGPVPPFDLSSFITPPAPAPAPSPIAPPRSGSGLGGVLQQMLPMILAGIAGKQGGPMAAGAMLQGYTQAAQRRQQLEREQAEREAERAATEEERQWRRAQYIQQQKERTANFIADAVKSIGEIDDPAQRAHAVQLYQQLGSQLFGLRPDVLASVPTRPAPDTSKQDAAEASRILTQLESKHGQQFASLVETGATVPFKGKPTSIRDLQALAGVAVSGPTGAPILPPAPTPPAPKYDEPWFIAEAIAEAEERAKAAGKPLSRGDKMRAAEAGRRRLAEAGRDPRRGATDDVDQVARRQAEVWRANQIAKLEEAKRPGKPDYLTGVAAPGLTAAEVAAEQRRIDASYDAMLRAAGIRTPAAAPQAPPSPRSAPMRPVASHGPAPTVTRAVRTGPTVGKADPRIAELARVLEAVKKETDPARRMLLLEQLRSLRAQVQ